jgi:hypothetical protein
MPVRLSESLYWAFEDNSWRFRIVVQGLILLVPVLGAIALAGWMLANLENLRAGRRTLAPNGFYVVEGIEMLLVWVIYALPLMLPYLVLATVSANLPRNGSLYLTTNIALLAGLVVLAWLLPAMIVATDRSGFLVGVWPHRVVGESVRNLRTTGAGLMLIPAGLIGLLGVFICLIGALFTVPYATTVASAAAAWWEQPLLREAPPGPEPAPVGVPAPAWAPITPASAPAPVAVREAVSEPAAPDLGLPPLRSILPPPEVLRPPRDHQPEEGPTSV